MCFTIEEFKRFMKRTAFNISNTPPYHPAANGFVERLIRTFKSTFRKMEGSVSLNEKLNIFLFRYRITPQSTTGISNID